MAQEQIAVADLLGTWRRTLLQDEHGRQDRTTDVAWVQGPSVFGDLRQPASLDPIQATCLRHLSRDEAVLLAQQEGFGGILIRQADHFQWTRSIDYQPKSARLDRGALAWQGDTLVETGYDVAYIEHWRRDAGQASRAGAAHLVNVATGVAGLLVHADERFAFIRDRAVPLAEATPLSQLVRAAPSTAAMQDLVDCEISMGSTDDWRIERSTLPWRVGAALAPQRSAQHLSTEDVGPLGEGQRHVWTIVDEESWT